MILEIASSLEKYLRKGYVQVRNGSIHCDPVQVGQKSYCRFLAITGYAAKTRDHETLVLNQKKNTEIVSKYRTE